MEILISVVRDEVSELLKERLAAHLPELVLQQPATAASHGAATTRPRAGGGRTPSPPPI